MLNKGTSGTIFITSLVWHSPWLGIEPGTSCTRCLHYTTRLSRRRWPWIIWVTMNSWLWVTMNSWLWVTMNSWLWVTMNSWLWVTMNSWLLKNIWPIKKRFPSDSLLNITKIRSLLLSPTICELTEDSNSKLKGWIVK